MSPTERENEAFNYGYALGKTEAIAARDKEWVEWVDIESAVIRLGDEQDILANGDYIAIPAKRWQERKKEIGL